MICLLQVKSELQDANLKASNSIAGMSSSAGSGWQQLKETQQELHRQHGAAMGSIRGQEAREWCVSLKAVGNIIAGNFSQVRTPAAVAAAATTDCAWFRCFRVYVMVWQQETGYF